MKILGIETSCDDTTAAVVEDGRHILSSVINSQIDIFAEYGGVIPEVAARSHLEAILPVINQSLKEAHCTWDDIDAIAVTHAPGLLGSLLIGTLTARTLAILHHKPLYAVHHLKSHIYANWLEEGSEDSDGLMRFRPDLRMSNLQPVVDSTMSKSGRKNLCFPLLGLVISGGHTQILYMPAHNSFEIIGTTKDDAIGECFDKVAKILGLPYPGGPSIAKAAEHGDPKKYSFPHPQVINLDFSFSGLKTSVLRTCQDITGGDFRTPSHELKNLLTPEQKADIAASFQNVATDIIVEKLRQARDAYPAAKSLVIAGGVSANQLLRAKLENYQTHGFDSHNETLCPLLGVPVYFPAPKLSGDNGAMVAAAAFYEIQSGVQPVNPYHLDIHPRIAIS